MNVNGRPMRTIWLAEDGRSVEIIDQRLLPHELVIARLRTLADAAWAIKDMAVRGAPLIGAMAAYGVALAMAADPSDQGIANAIDVLGKTRPTAVNLHWGLAAMRQTLLPLSPHLRHEAALDRAAEIAEEDVAVNRAIGEHGYGLIAAAQHRKSGAKGDDRVEILTHCNAGWLAAVDWGTGLAPVYRAHNEGVPLHVWVDETRPRNQGASLTAWELLQHGVPHTVIADNAGGHLMRHGKIDLCITGTDRTTATGDVANKIGTYLKALAAQDNSVPFYVSLPSSTIDWTLDDGDDIPIEERGAREVTHIAGWTESGERVEVRLTPEGSPAANYAFDVTPARLITGLITERGVCRASREGLLGLFPERRNRARA
jgi:methylthioribose-1-phosphate isomerase